MADIIQFPKPRPSFRQAAEARHREIMAVIEDIALGIVKGTPVWPHYCEDLERLGVDPNMSVTKGDKCPYCGAEE